MSMSLYDLAALALAMMVLAAAPSVSVLVVTSRAVTGGFGQGAMAALGVLVGDIVFILLAVFGLALLAEALGGRAYLIDWLAGAYLIGLGIYSWRVHGSPWTNTDTSRPLTASFLTGLLVTLGDQKAVLFYLGFLPAFVDLAAVSSGDITAIVLVSVLAVGGVKLAYAWSAARAGALFGERLGGGLNRLAAAVMIGVGGFMLARVLYNT